MIRFGHSCGGTASGAAATGYGKATYMGRGKEGGVFGLIYLAGNIVAEGTSLFEIGGSAWLPFIKR